MIGCEVPETPLATPAVLSEEKETWMDMNEEMEKTLASMRVGQDDVHIKDLATSNNKLLLKRKKAKADRS